MESRYSYLYTTISDRLAMTASSSTCTELLFSYGTLQDRTVQLANFGRELVGHPDTLPGYACHQLAISDPEVVALSGKTHHPIVQSSDSPTDRVIGTVFEITSAELAAADEYEVDDYQRISVVLGSGRKAWVYVKA